ncbi:MAG TPA: hypothetical protein VKA27_16085 [Sunxiuqinia sp.]|nr:hypothetical protein [Sunxiuqinia sp.]
MKQYYFIALLMAPLVVFSDNEIRPEGGTLLWIIAVLLLLPIIYYLVFHVLFKRGKSTTNPKFWWKRRLKVELTKDRKYRPRVLTLKVQNRSSKDIDLEAPVIHFRKLWTKRKFKLKGIDRYEIYPLYLEAGKTHELRIDLSVFFNYDRKLRRFLWAKVRLTNTQGKKYSSRSVTLRKSLFS